MAWQGKRLESLSGNGLTASYTYDEQGIRSGKTINGVTTSFSYNGSLLMAQVAPGKSLLFSYDANGQAVSVNYNGTEYYYLRNGQNDIVGLMDESGVRVVEYIYDAWGKLISTTGTLATTLGADNPFRYRGYYYDTETGLYYLTTRYYDPEVCRFISADVYMSTGQGVLGGNMWAYCLNNPVVFSDNIGQSVTICILGVTVSLAQLIVGALIVTASIDLLINGERSLPARLSDKIVDALETVVSTVAEKVEAAKPRKYRSSTEEHHIVAKKSPKSIIARKCFDDVGLKVEDDFIKVKVKTSLHRRLHTNIYYGLINTGVLIAYAIGRDKDSKANNIKAFVGTVSNILSSRSRSLKW